MSDQNKICGSPGTDAPPCGSRDVASVEATAALTFRGTPGDWKVFDHYCGHDPSTAGEYANTRLIGLSQFETIAEVRHGSSDVQGVVDANANLFAASKALLEAATEAREIMLALTDPKHIHRTAVMAVWSRCVESEVKLRAAIAKALGGDADG